MANKNKDRDWLTPPDCEYDLGDQLKEVDRELRMRKEVYPNQIKGGKLTSDTANRRWRRLKDIRRSLEYLQKITMENQMDLGFTQETEALYGGRKNKYKPDQ